MDTILIVVGIAFILLFLVLTIKQIEFVLVATDLYRKMIKNQKDIIVLLKDVRDETKIYVEPIPELVDCPHCGTKLRLSKQERQARTFSCVKCKKPISM